MLRKLFHSVCDETINQLREQRNRSREESIKLDDLNSELSEKNASLLLRIKELELQELARFKALPLPEKEPELVVHVPKYVDSESKSFNCPKFSDKKRR